MFAGLPHRAVPHVAVVEGFRVGDGDHALQLRDGLEDPAILLAVERQRPGRGGAEEVEAPSLDLETASAYVGMREENGVVRREFWVHRHVRETDAVAGCTGDYQVAVRVGVVEFGEHGTAYIAEQVPVDHHAVHAAVRVEAQRIVAQKLRAEVRDGIVPAPRALAHLHGPGGAVLAAGAGQ